MSHWWRGRRKNPRLFPFFFFLLYYNTVKYKNTYYLLDESLILERTINFTTTRSDSYLTPLLLSLRDKGLALLERDVSTLIMYLTFDLKKLSVERQKINKFQ